MQTPRTGPSHLQTITRDEKPRSKKGNKALISTAGGACPISANEKEMAAKPRARPDRAGRLHQTHSAAETLWCSHGTLLPCSFSSARSALAGS
jgi:hypothetical protein